MKPGCLCPKGYKQTEVGVIPEDWEISPLVELIDESRSIRYGIVQPGKFDHAGRYMIRGQDYSKGWSAPSELFKVSPQVEEPFKNARVKSGDVIITIVGASTGHIEVIPDWLDGANLTQTTARLAINPSKAFSDFCKFYLQSSAGQRQVANYLKGAAQPGLNCGDIEKFQIPLPPTLPEQRAIATALSDVDGLLGALDRLIAKKRDLKQAAMQQLLTGQTRLPGFTGKWETKTLPDVSRFRGGKAHEQYIADHGRFVCVNSKFISSAGKVRKYSTANFCSARAKDILMVMSDLPNGKALAKTFVADQDDLYAVNQRVCALTPFDDYCAEFLAYVLDRNPYFLKFDDGVSQTHLLNRVFQKCPVFVPPTKDEQTAIATVLSDMDLELAGLEQRREKTRALKQGMMQELLTGRTRLIG